MCMLASLDRIFNPRKLVLCKKWRSITSQFSMDIKTFIFLDSETTGLPSMENNRTRMTELCLTAVQSDHIRLGTFPRIQNKVTLCFNPGKFIHPEATNISGLCNELLEYQSAFNSMTASIIKDFISMQRQTVCFVAHNGNRFDYPILRAEISKAGSELPNEIVCVDSLEAFKDLYQEDMIKLYEKPKDVPVQQQAELPIEFQDGYDELLCSLVEELEKSVDYGLRKRTVSEIQKINETTPRKNSNIGSHQSGVAPAKRTLPFGKPSFKLVEVYKRLTSKEPTDAHKAEYDVAMMIECAAVLGERFVYWANLHARRFCDIPMMTPGQPIKI